MSELHKIVQVCKRCNGSGAEAIGENGMGNPPHPITCRKCGGSGEVSSNSLHPDLIDLFNDMNIKINDILERVSE